MLEIIGRKRFMMANGLLIRNGSVLHSDGIIRKSDIHVQDGVIDYFDSGFNADSTLDVDGCYVVPGLIDAHTHGLGYDSPMTSRLEDIAKLEASKGATSFCTTFFAPPAQIAEKMKQHREETDELRLTPQVVGFRVESPYLDHAGGGANGDLSPISEDITEMLLEAGGGHIKIWDVAPELDCAIDFIRRVSDCGIATSAAHTYCSVEQAKAAVDAGLRHVTHLFDTFEVPKDDGSGVYPVTLIDYLLTEDRVSCEIIGDGLHVHPTLVEKAIRCKPADKLLFVTDSNFGAGLPPGRYPLPGGWGDAIVNGANDGVVLAATGILCGSALSPIDLFRNVSGVFGKDLATASRLCATNPAKLIGLNKGQIEVGRDGDFIVLNEKMDLLYTIVGGEIFYRAESTL